MPAKVCEFTQILIQYYRIMLLWGDQRHVTTKTTGQNMKQLLKLIAPVALALTAFAGAAHSTPQPLQSNRPL